MNQQSRTTEHTRGDVTLLRRCHRVQECPPAHMCATENTSVMFFVESNKARSAGAASVPGGSEEAGDEDTLVLTVPDKKRRRRRGREEWVDGERDQETQSGKGRERRKGTAGEVKLEWEQGQESLRAQALTLSAQGRPRDPITQPQPQNQMGPSRLVGPMQKSPCRAPCTALGMGGSAHVPLASAEWRSAPRTS